MSLSRRILLGAMAILLGLSAVAAADVASPARPLPCAPGRELLTANWQAFSVDPFPSVAGAAGAGRISAFAVDPLNPLRVLITDGVSVRLSDTGGCGFRTVLTLPALPDPSLPVSGATAKVISMSFVAHRAVLLLREGSGATARAHVIISDTADSGTWRLVDTGLPVVGDPSQLHAAGDGRTLYLSVTPPGSLATGVRPLLGAGAPVLYRATYGSSWSARTSPSSLAFVHVLTSFAVDPGSASSLWGVVDGQLNQSRDGGATFVPVPSIDTEEAGYSFTVLDAYAPRSLVAFSTDSGDSGPVVLVTHNNGVSFRQQISPGIVTAAATRGPRPESELVSVSTPAGPKLQEYFIDGGRIRDVTPRFTSTAVDAAGDRLSEGATFYAHSDTQVLRYLDTLDRGQSTVDDPTFVNGIVAPPHPGHVIPSSRTVRLAVGSSSSVPFVLSLPPNPSPLDVFLAIDTSKSMHEVISGLQASFEDVAHTLARLGVNIEVGVGAIGTSTCPGSVPDPPTDPTVKGYVRPSPFKRLRAIGPLDSGLSAAIDSLSIETQPSTNGCDRPEGQLVALDQLASGTGVRDPLLLGSPVYLVAPGQVAGWRQTAAARRVIIVVTDGSFGAATGSPVTATGALDFARVAAALRDQRASVIGFSSGDDGATHDESLMARLTGGIAPPAGVDCFDADVVHLRSGAPVVCGTHEQVSSAVLSALAALSASDSIGITVSDPHHVIASVDDHVLRSVNLFSATSLPLSLKATCSTAGSFPVSFTTTLRGISVGSASLTVRCAGTAPPVIVPPAPAPPVPAPVAPAVAPPVPPAQPPGQVVNAQAQPAAAAQRQEELQLAVADQDQGSPDVEVGTADPEDRPMKEMAFSLLGMAVVSGAGIGLARRRSRTQTATATAWQSSK